MQNWKEVALIQLRCIPYWKIFRRNPFKVQFYSRQSDCITAVSHICTLLIHLIYSSMTSLRLGRSHFDGPSHLHHHLRLSLNHRGHWGTTDDSVTSFLHFSLFSTTLWDFLNSRPVHSPMLSSFLFFCLLCLLPPFTVPVARRFGPDLRNGRHVHAASVCISL